MKDFKEFEEKMFEDGAISEMSEAVTRIQTEMSEAGEAQASINAAVALNVTIRALRRYHEWARH